jgi:hypothetical protein
MVIIYLFLAGAIGALVKDIVVDNRIVLPKKVGNTITLGFVGAVIIGGFVGWAVDGSILVAALSGFTGLSAIENLLIKKPACKIE